MRASRSRRTAASTCWCRRPAPAASSARRRITRWSCAPTIRTASSSAPTATCRSGPGSTSIAASRVNAVFATTEPDAGLAIAQNSGVNVLVQASGAGAFIGTTSNHPVVFRTNDQDRVTIDTVRQSARHRRRDSDQRRLRRRFRCRAVRRRRSRHGDGARRRGPARTQPAGVRPTRRRRDLRRRQLSPGHRARSAGTRERSQGHRARRQGLLQGRCDRRRRSRSAIC